MENNEPNAEEQQFIEDLKGGLVAMKEASKTNTACVLKPAQLRAVLAVLEALYIRTRPSEGN